MQNCNGATTVSGETSGLQAKATAVAPLPLCSHCLMRDLNLRLKDATKARVWMANCMDHACEICQLVKCSPKREARLEQIKDLDAKGAHDSLDVNPGASCFFCCH